MEISEEEYSNLLSLVDLAKGSGASKLSSWENDFITSMGERAADFGQTMFMSDKQRAVIKRIEEKLGIE